MQNGSALPKDPKDQPPGRSLSRWHRAWVENWLGGCWYELCAPYRLGKAAFPRPLREALSSTEELPCLPFPVIPLITSDVQLAAWGWILLCGAGQGDCWCCVRSWLLCLRCARGEAAWERRCLCSPAHNVAVLLLRASHQFPSIYLKTFCEEPRGGISGDPN